VEAYRPQVGQVRPLPGARELLDYLSRVRVPWAIATSGRISGCSDRDSRPVGPCQARPDLFVEAAVRLGVEVSQSVVVGDGVWDLLAARRARALGSAYCRDVMGRKSLNGRVPIACTRIQPPAQAFGRGGCAGRDVG
jgi:phosphoglycolate phosphatase-like HAD superfamily hydrolase